MRFWVGKTSCALRFFWMGHTGGIHRGCSGGASPAAGPAQFESSAVHSMCSTCRLYISFLIYNFGTCFLRIFFPHLMCKARSWVEFSFILRLGKPTLLSRQTLPKGLPLPTVEGWDLLGVTFLVAVSADAKEKPQWSVVWMCERWGVCMRVSRAAMHILGCRWDGTEGTVFGGSWGSLYFQSLVII